MAQDVIQQAADYLLTRYGNNVAGLMLYGSLAFGKARQGSIPDFWVIVDDLPAFHQCNAEYYQRRLRRKGTVTEQLALNRTGPQFYRFRTDDIEMKVGVLDVDGLERQCRGRDLFVKGRMQKPLRLLRSCGRIESALQTAHRDGLRMGLNLVESVFTLNDVLFQTMSLSYRTEIRPERMAAKVRSIITTGLEPLREIYEPLLAEVDFVVWEEDRWRDTRSEAEQMQTKKQTLAELRRMKWSRRTLTSIWRNYSSYEGSIAYILRKAKGELEKLLRR